MKRILLALGLCAFVALLAVPVASAHDGRDPEDNFEVEGHFGFYWNLAFPTGVRENPAYTTFLNGTTNPAFVPLFRPQIRSKDFRWHGGVRVSGDVSPRFSLEYTFEVSQGDNFRFNRAYINTVLPERLAAVPTLTVRRFRGDDGHVLIHHGNLVFHTRESGKLIPYVTGGLTVIQYGSGPLIDLHFADGSDETDVFGYESRHTKVGGNVGGGIKYYATRHVGIRGDARFVLTPSRFTQRGAIIRPTLGPASTFGPDVTQTQRGLYSNLHISFGIFGRF